MTEEKVFIASCSPDLPSLLSLGRRVQGVLSTTLLKRGSQVWSLPPAITLPTLPKTLGHCPSIFLPDSNSWGFFLQVLLKVKSHGPRSALIPVVPICVFRTRRSCHAWRQLLPGSQRLSPKCHVSQSYPGLGRASHSGSTRGTG